MKSLRIITIFSLIATLVLTSCGVSKTDRAGIDECYATHDDARTLGLCITAIALEKESKSESLEICDEIDNGVLHTCRREVAMKFQDKPLCYDNENEVETRICLMYLGEILNDTAICDEIEGKVEFNECYRLISQKRKDVSLCDNLMGEAAQETCRSSVELYIESENNKAAKEADSNAASEGTEEAPAA